MFSNISCCQNNRLTSSKVTAVTKIQPEFQAMPRTNFIFGSEKKPVQTSFQKSLASSIFGGKKVYLRAF